MKNLIKNACAYLIASNKNTRGSAKEWETPQRELEFTRRDDLFSRATYRLSKSRIQQMTVELTPYYNIHANAFKYSVLTRLLATIYYLAHGITFKVLERVFQISDTTLQSIVWMAIENINTLYSDTFIQYKNRNEGYFEAQSNLFVNHYNLPELAGSFGVVDCTYIYSKVPDDDNWFEYVDKDRDICVKAQVLCDFNYTILDVLVGYPGGVHDAAIFQVKTVNLGF